MSRLRNALAPLPERRAGTARVPWLAAASCFERDDVHLRTDRRGTGHPRLPGRCGHRAARRQVHRSLHRALPQRGHWRARRYAAAHARRATDISSRTRGPAAAIIEEHRRHRESSRRSCRRPSPTPTRRRDSKISICRTSRSGAGRSADRARSRPRAACAGVAADPTLVPEEAAPFLVDSEKGVADVAAALEGARWILIDTFAEDAELVGGSPPAALGTAANGHRRSSPGKRNPRHKFSDYFSAQRAAADVPSHRALALFRGRKKTFFVSAVVLPHDDTGTAT